MSQKEEWKLKNFSVETKKAIQKLAKKNGMFTNDYVKEILDKYLADEELERNKNFFDRRWQEVIEAMKFFSENQQKETEMWVKAFQSIEEGCKNFAVRLMSLEMEMVIDQELLKKIYEGVI